MRRLLLVTLTGIACSSPTPEVELSKVGRVEGVLLVGPEARGDAYAFLYPPGQGYPADPAVPLYVSAVSDVRLAVGDTRFLFSAVAPNPHRLWAFLDVDRDFDPTVDVLSQPGAGDRVAAQGAELNLQPSEKAWVELELKALTANEPPAFRLDGYGAQTVTLADVQVSPVSWLAVADPVDRLDAERTQFRVSLVDSNADGVPDDEDGDGLPDLFPRFLLRFLPRPGQLLPTNRQGEPGEVVVPLLFDPGPFLASLGGAVGRELAVDRLQLFVLPTAQGVVVERGRGTVVTPLDAVPVGDYELLALTRGGQFWRLPNGLGELGLPSQAVRFRVVHGVALPDAGR